MHPGRAALPLRCFLAATIPPPTKDRRRPLRVMLPRRGFGRDILRLALKARPGYS